MEGGVAAARVLPSLPGNAFVRNTFLEFQDDNFGACGDDEEDPWMMTLNPRRMKTDSVVERSSLRAELEESVAHMLKRCDVSSRDEAEGETGGDSAGDQAPPAPVAPASLESPSSAAGAASTLSAATPAFIPGPPVAAWEGNATTAAVVVATSSSTCADVGASYSAESTTIVMPPFMPGGAVTEAVGNEEPKRERIPTPVDPELVKAREVAAAGGGLSGNSTVMVRHIPGKYTQQKLMREINSIGFLGKYDFFYLPMQPQSRGNRGFAFVNFINSEAADQFYTAFHGRRLRHFRSEQPIAVMPADLQGFEKNAEHYATIRRAGGRRPLQSGRALFFKPLPPHLSDAGEQQSWSDPAFMATACGGGGGGAVSTVGSLPEMPAMMGGGGNSCGGGMPGAGGGDVGPSTDYAASPAGCVASSNRASNFPMQQAQQALVQRFCAYCGNQKNPDHAFCIFCGARSRQ